MPLKKIPDGRGVIMHGVRSDNILNNFGEVYFKKLYSGFDNEMLNSFLKDHKIDTLIFTGLYTDICILNNVVYAFHLGYDTTIVRDCTIATDQDQEFDYQYMKDLYNTKIIDKDYLELYIGED